MNIIYTNDLTKSELISILEVIDSSSACRSAECLRKLLLKIRDLIEADFSICGLIRKRDLEPLDISALVNGSYPDTWLNRYISEKMHLTDPVVRHHTRFSDTILWKDLPESDESADRNIVMAMDHGIRHGLSGSIYLPGRDDIAVFAFSGPHDSFISRHAGILDTVLTHLGRTLSDMTYGDSAPVEQPEVPLYY